MNQRRYEALRAYFIEDLTVAEAGARAGYTRAAWPAWSATSGPASWSCSRRPASPAPRPRRPGSAPAAGSSSCAAQGLSVYEISTRLRAGGHPAEPHRRRASILAEEGFGRLLRGPAPEASTSPATSGRDTRLPAAARHRLRRPARHARETAMAGLLLAVPDLVALDLPALAAAAGYPGTRVIPAVVLAAVPAGAQAHRAPGGSPTSMTCSPTPPPRCSPGWRSCRRRPRSPTTPTGCPTTTSSGSWPPSTSR